jgi:glucokinase
MAADSTKDCWVGFDLGGTKMLATVFDENFQPLGRRRKKTRGHEGMDVGQKRIVQTIRQALDDAQVDIKRIAGIGIGSPGPLDLDRGIILEAPNLAWENLAIREFLENEFGCPVALINDVDAGVYGEYQFGAAKGARCALGVFPGTGIGGGCVYDGRIMRGVKSSCMEIGHIRVLPDGPRCGCGLTGCLEAVASRLAISAQAAQAAFRGQAPNLRRSAGTDLGDIRSGVLADAIDAGDTVVEQIVRTAGERIGVAVATVVHLISPDCIVLGGGLVEAMPKLFVEEVEQSAREHVMPAYKKSFSVVAAELGDDAAVMGTAAWCRETVQGTPST